MKILLTGASSFTGYWFSRTLAEAGHDVISALSGPDIEAYAGVRAERVHQLTRFSRVYFGAPMGSDALLRVIKSEAPLDVFCHHWADVRGYREADYDVLGAVASATHRLVETLRAFMAAGCGHLILTGSVFEENEGAGDRPLRSFNPYGFAKSLTWRYVKYHCEREGVCAKKFVIPNPFGPYEEPRFTNYLMRTWRRCEIAKVLTPRYVRDNIHVDLLAKTYAQYVVDASAPGAAASLSPSGYPETQGAFAQRVATAVKERLGLDCLLEFSDQRDFQEPAVRIGTDVPDLPALGWKEAAAWDAFAEYYRDPGNR